MGLPAVLFPHPTSLKSKLSAVVEATSSGGDKHVTGQFPTCITFALFLVLTMSSSSSSSSSSISNKLLVPLLGLYQLHATDGLRRVGLVTTSPFCLSCSCSRSVSASSSSSVGAVLSEPASASLSQQRGEMTSTPLSRPEVGRPVTRTGEKPTGSGAAIVVAAIDVDAVILLVGALLSSHSCCCHPLSATADL